MEEIENLKAVVKHVVKTIAFLASGIVCVQKEFEALKQRITKLEKGKNP